MARSNLSFLPEFPQLKSKETNKLGTNQKRSVTHERVEKIQALPGVVAEWTMAARSASSANYDEYPVKTSSSRSLASTVTVAHNFEITGYSLLDGFRPGDYICSRRFGAGGYDWCIRFFFKKHIVDDCFTIRCVLTVITHHTEDRSTVVIPRSNLHDHLVDMLEGGEGTDVTFSVSDQLFHAHGCMLAARSLVFKAELFSGMEENATRHIKVDDIEPAIFQALLHFIYTDTFPHDSGVDKNAPLQHLFVAADRYGLDRLAAMREQRLCESIDVHTVATTLALAEQHQCVELKHACLGFLSSHGVLSDIQETDGFKHLISSCPSVVGDIINSVAIAGGRAAKRARVEATHSSSSSSYTGD
uniref:Speckle-type POZ protein-like protein n=1 Tax=Aegilops tauschii TaxID=37682 RepID=M8CFV1_AEGTA